MNRENLIVMLVCTLGGLLYLFIFDRVKKNEFNRSKYLAVILCFCVAILATWLGTLQTVIGAPMIGLFIGMLLVNLIPSFGASFRQGSTFASKKYLNLGIIFIGGTLNFGAVLSATKALPLIIFNIFLSFIVAYLIGRKIMKLSSETCTLVGGGTAICGGSAIATLASIIKAKEEDIAYAMTAIFIFDILAAILFPYLADFLHLSSNQYGFIAGCAINDTSSVVASQSTYLAQHPELTEFNLAVTVKLVRTTMLIFVSLAFAVFYIRKEAKLNAGSGESVSVLKTVKKVFPWFVLGFIVMAVLNTLGVFEHISFIKYLFKYGNKFFVTTALVGVGFKIKFKDLFVKGAKPMILGGCTWACVALSALVFVHLFSGFVG